LKKIIILVENPLLKEKNREKHLTQFNKFSWDKTAKETLAAYKYFEKQN
jgi:glycosyltransferase involved in cell wall biosynthesis